MTSTDTRPFRFGVVTPIQAEMSQWRDQVRRIADSGYSTVLMPDVQQWQPAPGPTLAMAATLAPELRVGTWVYASPLRPPSTVAWESHSLSVVTEGRFEMGIGPGRPGMEDELREYGLPVATPAERLTQVRDSVNWLRKLDGPDLHTPVVVAAHGPKSWELAAEVADTVICGTPGTVRADILRHVTDTLAGHDLELALHVPFVGDDPSPFMTDPSVSADDLRAADSLSILPSDPKAAVEELQRRREEGGFSYIVIGSNAAETFAPVVAELTGN